MSTGIEPYFITGRSYRNRIGVFEVISIEGQKIVIAYESGDTAMT
jgi:hypothetical protein